jgi:hypothetical protein
MPWIALIPLFPSSCDVSACASINNDPNGAPLAAPQRGEGHGSDAQGGLYTHALREEDSRTADGPQVESTADALATTVY